MAVFTSASTTADLSSELDGDDASVEHAVARVSNWLPRPGGADASKRALNLVQVSVERLGLAQRRLVLNHRLQQKLIRPNSTPS